MSILISDLDEPIISFMDLPEIVNLMQTNKNYYEKIKYQTLIKEWNEMKDKKCTLNEFFWQICEQGYITYAKSLFNRYTIDIHFHNEKAFGVACTTGHLETAKWLIYLGENGDRKINIHYNHDVDFKNTCFNGHLEVAKFMIELGENGYGKINIHRYEQQSFRSVCQNGHLSIALWLVELGENGYGKINIHVDDDNVFRLACRYKHWNIATWLIELGKNGYGEIKQEIITAYYLMVST